MSKNIVMTVALFAVALLSANCTVLGQTSNPTPWAGEKEYGLVDFVEPGKPPSTDVKHVGSLGGSRYVPGLNPFPPATSHGPAMVSSTLQEIIFLRRRTGFSMPYPSPAMLLMRPTDSGILPTPFGDIPNLVQASIPP